MEDTLRRDGEYVLMLLAADEYRCRALLVIIPRKSEQHRAVSFSARNGSTELWVVKINPHKRHFSETMTEQALSPPTTTRELLGEASGEANHTVGDGGASSPIGVQKKIVEHDLIVKAEEIARLEHQNNKNEEQVKSQTDRVLPVFAFGAAGLPALRPTKPKISQPAFPKIEIESSQASEILPYLYLAGNIVARDLTKIKEKGITRVLNVAGGVCPNYFPQELKYTSFELLDAPHEEIDYFILYAVAEIEDALQNGEKILVHCHQGASRSATLVVAYVAYKLEMSIVDALVYVKSKRSIVSPNRGFLDQLAAYETRRNEEKQGTVYRLTAHSKHVPTLVLKQVPAHSVFNEHPNDVYVGVHKSACMLVRRPGASDDSVKIDLAVKLTQWMQRFDPAYMNFTKNIEVVEATDKRFAELLEGLPAEPTAQVEKPIIEHVLLPSLQ